MVPQRIEVGNITNQLYMMLTLDAIHTQDLAFQNVKMQKII